MRKLIEGWNRTHGNCRLADLDKLQLQVRLPTLASALPATEVAALANGMSMDPATPVTTLEVQHALNADFW